jgi:hypothetical protein
MSMVIKDFQNTIIDGLGTYTHTCAKTGIYNASAIANVVPASSLSITIAQSGSQSVSVTSGAPAPAQSVINLYQEFNCTAADVITFTITSAAAIDNQLNTVKTILSVGYIA